MRGHMGRGHTRRGTWGGDIHEGAHGEGTYMKGHMGRGHIHEGAHVEGTYMGRGHTRSI